MTVWMLWDYGSLVGIYSNYAAANELAERLRRECRETIGDDTLIVVESYTVKD